MDPRQRALPTVWDFDENQFPSPYSADNDLYNVESDTEEQQVLVAERSPPRSATSYRQAAGRSAYIRIDEDDASWSNGKSGGGRQIPMDNATSGRLRLTSSNSTGALPTIMENSNKTPAPIVEPLASSTGYESLIKRWDTETKMATPWHIPPRDSDLFMANGNCLVYLCSKEAPVRNAVFRIPLANIHDKHFSDIFHIYESHLASMRPQHHADLTTTAGLCELFIPAPEILDGQDPSIWHVTMRNFFAFLCDRPVVGASLTRTLLDLHRRITRIRPNSPDNNRDFFVYLNKMGYLDFNFCPDYALASLQIAEQFEVSDLWVDAFTHCVGMSNILVMSSEYETASPSAKVAITKASMEVDIFLGRVTKALSNFLEDALSPSRLGLGQDARVHLDRFRSFLHSFYVEKFGYWPPSTKERFPKALFKSMYFDFRDLYDLLSDSGSSDSLMDQRPATGGICVTQNISAFNKRHKFDPLPHSMPLLPEPLGTSDTRSQRSGRLGAVLGSQQHKGADSHFVQATLFEALNKQNLKLFSSPLVRAYLHFEKQWSQRRDIKISVAESRKVRWILIYGVLQMLISVLRAPREVRDIEGPTYPLCSPKPVSPPWIEARVQVTTQPLVVDTVATNTSLLSEKLEPVLEEEDEPKIEIAPDCEKTDFIARPRSSRSFRPRFNSISSSIHRPSSSASSPSRFGGSTIRSFSLINKMRKPPPLPKPERPKFCAIVVDGYGDGMDATYENGSRPTTAEEDPFVLLAPSEPLPEAREVPALIIEDHGDEEPEQRANPSNNLLAGPWPLVPADITRAREQDLRTPCLDEEEMQKMYQPYNDTQVSSSEYSISEISSDDNDITPRAKDIMRDVIIPGLKNGDIEVNPRDSCQTSSDSSQESALRPATPQDEEMMPSAPGFGFDRQVFVPTQTKLEPGLVDDDLDEEPPTPRPFHGIHIKRTFSVESFIVSGANDTTETAEVQVKKQPSSNLRHQSSRDYLANNLDRTSSVTSIRSNTPSSFSRPLRFLAPSPLPFQRSSSIGRVPEAPTTKTSRWGLSKALSRSNSNASSVVTVGYEQDHDGSRAPSRSGSIVGSRLKRLYLG